MGEDEFEDMEDEVQEEEEGDHPDDQIDFNKEKAEVSSSNDSDVSEEDIIQSAIKSKGSKGEAYKRQKVGGDKVVDSNRNEDEIDSKGGIKEINLQKETQEMTKTLINPEDKQTNINIDFEYV